MMAPGAGGMPPVAGETANMAPPGPPGMGGQQMPPNAGQLPPPPPNKGAPVPGDPNAQAQQPPPQQGPMPMQKMAKRAHANSPKPCMEAVAPRCGGAGGP